MAFFSKPNVMIKNDIFCFFFFCGLWKVHVAAGPSVGLGHFFAEFFGKNI
jgi:hypothetical protein